MKKLLILLLPFFAFGQLEINSPDGWMDYSNGDEETLNRINIWGEKLVDAIIENSDLDLKNFTELKYYTKYDIYNTKSFRSIPSIRVYLLKNYMNKTLNELKEYYLKDWELMEKKELGHKNLKIIESSILNLNNRDAIKFKIEFDFLNPYLNIMEKHRSRILYFFVSKNYYIQISMNDTEDDNCNLIFERFLDEIKLN